MLFRSGRDSYGDTLSATTTQRITNVAPVVSSAPVATAVENQPYTYQLVVTDPGSADTQTFTRAVLSALETSPAVG